MVLALKTNTHRILSGLTTSKLVLSICDSDIICILSFSVPFELWLLELLMSAQLQLVRPAATCHFSCQLSCSISAQLHPVSSDETCHLNCNVLAELLSVSSAATCQLSCKGEVSCQLSCSLPNLLSAQVNLLAWLSAQLHPVTSDVICHVSSSASSHHQSIISAAVYPLSYILSFLGSYLMCHISWNLSAGRTRHGV